MKARKRYLLLIICIAFLTALYLGFVRLKSSNHDEKQTAFFSMPLIGINWSSHARNSSHHVSSKINPRTRRSSYLNAHDVDISSPFHGSDDRYSRKGAIWKPIQPLRGNQAFSSLRGK